MPLAGEFIYVTTTVPTAYGLERRRYVIRADSISSITRCEPEGIGHPFIVTADGQQMAVAEDDFRANAELMAIWSED